MRPLRFTVDLSCVLLPANMSQELTWQLIKKHNSFLIRRDGVLFSTEPNNLTNKNSFKYSGLANNSTVGVEINTEGKGCVLVTKKKSSAARRRPASAHNRTVLRKDFRYADPLFLLFLLLAGELAGSRDLYGRANRKQPRGEDHQGRDPGQELPWRPHLCCSCQVVED